MKLNRTLCFAAWFSSLFAASISVWAEDPSRPNIIFILADDVGVESMTPYGCSSWSTPRIDSIAEQGMRFANAFANPSCTAARGQFMTGRYPFRTGMTYPTMPNGPLDLKEITLATVLKEAGYSTGLAGKWNLRYGSNKGASESKQAEHINAHGFDEHRSFIGHTIVYGDPAVETNFVPYQLNQWACDFISRQATNDAPFYLQYSLGLVHWPLTATPLNPDATKENSSDDELYGQMMIYMDQMVGNVLDTLDRSNLSSNTVVFFSGDNGSWKRIKSTFNGEQVQGGKLSTKDTGSWVPLYVRWPGVVASASLYDGLTDFSDLFPTFIEIGRSEVPDDRVIDGVSFLPQLKGSPAKHREFVYCSSIKKRTFVRNTEWKLVNGTNLFDVCESPIRERLIEEATQTAEEAAARSTLLAFMETIQGRETKGKDRGADDVTDIEKDHPDS